MPKVLICTPAYGGNMGFEYVISLLRLDHALRARNIGVDYAFLANESLIQRARNYLCKQFMDAESFTHLLFIDADIQFQPDDILRMIDAQVPLIGGVYPKKKIHWDRNTAGGTSMAHMLDYVVTPLDASTTISNIYEPQPVKYVGTGCMLIAREVLEAMQIAAPDRWFFAEGVKYYAFFDCIFAEDKTYLSEDYYFCNVWRNLGGTVYAAYWTRLTHWGIQGFDGNIFAIS